VIEGQNCRRGTTCSDLGSTHAPTATVNAAAESRLGCDLPTYPAPTTQIFLTAIRGNSVSLRTRDCDKAASLRSSNSEGRNNGLALGVVGPVEQDRLPSEVPSDGEEEEKTSMGISSLDMVASGGVLCCDER
jgi:hypothetical protein